MDMICGYVDMICGYVMDMQSTYESIVLGPAAKEGRVFTSEEKTFCQKTLLRNLFNSCNFS